MTIHCTIIPYSVQQTLHAFRSSNLCVFLNTVGIITPTCAMTSSMTADSSNFDSPIVNAFVDDIQDKFVQVVMSIAGYMHVLQCTLQLHLSLGHGYTRSTNMSTDPMLQPLGDPIVEMNSLRGNRILRASTSELFNHIRTTFRELSNKLVSTGSINIGSVTNIVADLRLGAGHHSNMSMRIRPVVHIGLGPDGHGMSFEMTNGDSSDLDDDPMHHPVTAVQDEILLFPITSMAKDSFMNHFNKNGSSDSRS